MHGAAGKPQCMFRSSWRPLRRGFVLKRGPDARTASGTCGSGLGWLGPGEALHERQRGAGDLAPAAVDGEGVPVAGDLDDLGHVLVALLALVGGVGDRRRRTMALSPGV